MEKLMDSFINRNSETFCQYFEDYRFSKLQNIKEYQEIKEEKCITLAFVGDERICDGYYYASSFKLLSKYLKKPELLEELIEEKDEITN